MELELGVRKLEKRETKQEVDWLPTCAVNPDLLNTLLGSCTGGCGCQSIVGIGLCIDSTENYGGLIPFFFNFSSKSLSFGVM